MNRTRRRKEFAQRGGLLCPLPHFDRAAALEELRQRTNAHDAARERTVQVLFGAKNKPAIVLCRENGHEFIAEHTLEGPKLWVNGEDFSDILRRGAFHELTARLTREQMLSFKVVLAAFLNIESDSLVWRRVD